MELRMVINPPMAKKKMPMMIRNVPPADFVSRTALEGSAGS
jgi:hypothetical protein